MICSEETLNQLISATSNPNPHVGFVVAAGSSLHFARFIRTQTGKRSLYKLAKQTISPPPLIQYCLHNHQQFHQTETSHLFVRFGKVTGSDKDSYFSQEMSASPPDVTSTSHPNMTGIPKPNTAACEHGDQQGLYCSVPRFLNKHKGESTHEQFTFNPVGAPKVIRLTSKKKKKNLKKR